jgi:hypothetical protein
MPQTIDNGVAPRVDHATDTAALSTLTAVTTALAELSRAIEAIGVRLDSLEAAVASQATASRALTDQLLAARPASTPPAAPARTPRAPRANTQALRDSATASIDRRSRRTTAPAAEPDDAAGQ